MQGVALRWLVRCEHSAVELVRRAVDGWNVAISTVTRGMLRPGGLLSGERRS